MGLVLGGMWCGAPPLQPRAAQTLGCSADQIQSEQPFSENDYVKIVSGCGKKDVLDYSDRKWNSLRDRAAYELSCDAGALEVTILSPDTYGVAGCDHKAVYKWMMIVGMVMESRSAKGQDPTPARKPAAPAKQ